MARIPGLSQTNLIGGGGGGSRMAITKKLVLWTVLTVQMGFICCIWLLQMNRNHVQQQKLSKTDSDTNADRVHFIRKPKNTITHKLLQGDRKSCAYRENANRYQQDFFQMKFDKPNHTAAEDAMAAYIDLELSPELWCYAEGTIIENRTDRDRDYGLLAQPQCLCASGWHGRDCGQPEIIWRALMTHSRASKRAGFEAPLKLHEASATSVKRLYYMLNLGDWEHINMELLQLQLQTLLEVVDFFLIYYYVGDAIAGDTHTQRRLERNLKNVPSSSYMLYQCAGPGSLINCSTAASFGYFRHQLWKRCGVQVQAIDLLLYGEREAIYAPAALKFLKYYAKDVLPLRFRLKYTVYGFYWQHPKRTRLQGVISSLVHLLAAQMDVPRLEQHTQYTLGDLNHFGGWFCEFCMPPEQIVHMLQTQSSHRKNVVPLTASNDRIDATYLQKVIGDGVYLDGTSTQLLRLRQQSEKYFAPPQALQHSSQFGQLLFNSYDVNGWEDVDDED